MKSLKLLMCIGAAGILMACGGGNKSEASSKSNPPSTAVTTTANSVATIDVLTSSNVLQSSGGEVLITAFVKNASNTTIPDETVVFSATSGNLQVVSAVSDASGAVTAKLSAGSNKSIRNITVTVTKGTVTGNVVISVTDTAVTVATNAAATIDVLTSSNSLFSSGGEVLITAYVKNASNTTISGESVVFSATSGNLQVVSAVSDASGAVTAKLSAGSNKSIRNITVTVTKGSVIGMAVISVTDTAVTVAANTAATIDVLTSSNVLQSSGAEVLITAYIKNDSNATIPGANVVFSAASGNLQVVSAVTDASGVVTAKLSAGSNKTIRNIPVTVTAGAVSGNVVIAVTDTAATVVGNGTLPQGDASSVYTVRAVDSANVPIRGATFSVTSSLSNPIASSPITTNASGSATFTYTPTNAGSDTLTISGLGLVTKTSVAVSNVDLSVVSPPSDAQITVGTEKKIAVQYKIATAGQANKTVTFSTTRGIITCDSVPCVTDVNGQSIATLKSTTAGPATVLAQIADVGQVRLPVQFMAGAPNTVVVQVNPGAVSPNLAGSTTNQSTIEALVRDANLNAVANTPVAFSLVSDLSNGSLSSGVATTDVNGRAQVQFIPGANSTANNGVVIKAEAGATLVVSGQATLTVSGQALFINIAYGNEMYALDTTKYTKPYSVYVTTATGGAVQNQTLSLSVIPIYYYKGSMEYGVQWKEKSPIKECSNEDLNENGILDPGEDINGSLSLTPGNIASLNPITVTTDTSGMASFNIIYGKQFALWSRVEIVAQTTVAGTESSRSIQFQLPISADDIGVENKPPAGENSPFGKVADCTDKN